MNFFSAHIIAFIKIEFVTSCFCFRRMMIEKIASHLGDFSPRLQSNTRALYQVRNIPALKCEKITVVVVI